MRFFFYGTLLDRDVREAVLGPARGEGRGRPAILPGYARRRAGHGNYPVLVRRRGLSVRGEVFEDLSPREILMIAHFEGREYGPVRKTVIDHRGRARRPAWVFLPVRGNDATTRPWRPEIWERRGTPMLLRDIHRWSRELDVGTLHAQDIAWPARRTLERILRGTLCL